MKIKILNLIFSALLILPFFSNSQGVNQTGIVASANKTNPGKTWAVVIGITKYKNIPGLNFADRDAQAFYNYLVNTDGGPKINPVQVRLLLNENALSTEIYGALDWLSESVKENDRVIFYFSGHGDVETKTTNRDGFLLAYNSPKAAYMTSGTVSVNYLQKYLENYVNVNKAKNVILIADACRSGKLAGGLEGTELTTQALGRNSDSRITRMLSAQENELSLEGSKWGGGRGVFSYYLVKGLEGLADRNNDNQVSTAELADYLLTVIPDVTGNTQHPEIEGDAKQELFSFDKHSASTLKDDENVTPFTTDNMGIGIADELAPDIQIAYKKYLNYIKNGRLLSGDSATDTVNCARHLYLQLIDKSGAEAIRPSLKSSFIAALQRKSDDFLEQYANQYKKVSLNGIIYNKVDYYTHRNETFYVKGLISPVYVLYNSIMARVYFFGDGRSTTNLDTIINLFKKALSFEPDAPYILNEIANRYQQKNLDSALYYSKKIIAIAPNWASPYFNIGCVYDSLKEYRKAILNYNKAIQLDSTNVQTYVIHHDIGIVYQKLDQYDKALIYHQNAARLLAEMQTFVKVHYNNYDYNNDDLKFAQRTIYFALGIDYQKLNDLDSAVSNYQKAIKADSTYKYALNNLGTVYQLQKKYELAIVNFKKAIAIDSGSADPYDNLGMCYVYKKEFKKGITNLEKALALASNDIIVHYNLASAYSIWGKPDKSIVYLKWILDNGYKDYDQIMQDEDLINLRKKESFTQLIKKYFPDKIVN